jgi:hypothetical protein
MSHNTRDPSSIVKGSNRRDINAKPKNPLEIKPKSTINTLPLNS